MYENGVLLRSEPTIVMTRTADKDSGRDYISPRRGGRLRVGMDDLVQDVLNDRLVVMGLGLKGVNRGIIEDGNIYD